MLEQSQIERALTPNPGILTKVHESGKPITDIVEANIGQTVEALPFSQLDPDFFIYSRFAHISVNPAIADDTDFILQSYKFENERDRFEEPLSHFVNYSEKHARAFLDQLIETARIHQVLSVQTDVVGRGAANLNTQRCFLLAGEKGAGKTYFLNFLLSKYNDSLDEKGTVWVRLNLVTPRGFDDDLVHWVHAQIAKIILRYYDRDSDFCIKNAKYTHHFYKYLQDWIEREVPDSLKLDMQTKLFEMYQVFCRKGSERHINPQLCHTNLCIELYRYCRTQLGLAFIIVLDGHDQLDIDQDHVKRFSTLAAQVKQLFDNYEPNGCIFLVVCRYRTLDLVRTADPYRNFQASKRYELRHVGLPTIFDRRIECIIDEIEKFIGMGRTQFAHTPWRGLLTEFRNNLINKGEIAYLERVLHHNNRDKMYVIQTAFRSYLKKKTGHAYRLLEHMVRAGFSYPPISYDFFVKGEEIVTIRLADVHYESRFLPVISRPPVPRNEQGVLDSKFYNSESPLHGIRLLQIVRTATDMHNADRNFSRVTIGELSEILNKLFGYKPEITSLYVKELECYEIVRIRNVAGVEAGSEFSSVEFLQKGTFLLDECISDAAYLNLCAMRTLVKNHPDGLNLFRVAKLGNSTLPEVQNWIATKIINCISLASIFVAINESQRKKLESGALKRIANDREREIATRAVQKGVYDVFKSLNDKIISQIHVMLKSVQQTRSIDELSIARTVSGFLLRAYP